VTMCEIDRALVGYARLLPPRWRAFAWRLARLAG